jgi:hypothetical protein
MFDGLEHPVRVALMKILAALYESGLVEEVELVDVMRLFGVTQETNSSLQSTRFSFSDEGWIAAYMDFIDSEAADDNQEIANGDLDSDRNIH